MSELRIDPNPIELSAEEQERFDRLSDMAERGEILPLGKPRRRAASAGPISAEEFEEIMARGRSTTDKTSETGKRQ
ncbi:hypothetical protein [Bifidobacterium coryneforme]|uniref:hypothetical protein n=1 Tax=Bifidobacterium coryneforme TaxID=1687 RepID=UPI0005F93277|nr:hypothetical protein [Bifidobacterium coryneforme]